MKTLEQLHKEILASEELKAAFFEAAKDKDTFAAFLKEHDCGATIGEFSEYMKTLDNSGEPDAGSELDDGDVEAVAGGASKNGKVFASVVSLGFACTVEVIKSAITKGTEDAAKCLDEALDTLKREM